MPMGKGFAINSNHELGAMVCEGYARYTQSSTSSDDRPKALPRIRVAAIANDAVSTLMSLMYSIRPMLHSKTVIGLILGTGCNAATLMDLAAIGPSKWPPMQRSSGRSEVVVNTEWTIRGAAGPLHELGLLSCWDSDLHKSTHVPGYQPFEYMTAGSYLGEVVRLVVWDWYTNVLSISESHLPPTLKIRNALTTTFLAQSVAIAEDSSSLASELNRMGVLGSNEHWIWTAELAHALLEAERAVLRRSAAMIAAAIVGLLLSTGEIALETPWSSGANATQAASQPVRELVVTYCGGLICLYKGYRQQLQESIECLLGQLKIHQRGTRIVLREASEGGIVGAAVLAGTALEGPGPMR
jgi:hexokinase